MALAENYALRRQKPAGAGEGARVELHGQAPDDASPERMRPARFQEPRPQGLLERHTEVGFELVLDPVVPQLGREDERQVAEELVELFDHGKTHFWNPRADATSWSRPKRSRKKRRKKKLPRTRRLPRQWHARCAGFAGDDAPCVMFPSVVTRPRMLRIMAGMDQHPCRGAEAFPHGLEACSSLSSTR